jgi:hypothetical protein
MNTGRSNRRKTIICVLLDAFRWDYITEVDMPFLFALTQTGIFANKLISTAGFTQRSVVFTGTYGDTRNQLTAFIHNQENSPFWFLQEKKQYWKLDEMPWWQRLPSLPALNYIKILCEDRRKRREAEVRNWVNSEAKKYANHAPSARIPFRLLPFFCCAEDATPIWDPSDKEIESIFSVLREGDLRFEYVMYPVVDCMDDEALDLVCERASSKADIYFVTFTEADSVCHMHGTSSLERRRAVGEVDRKMRFLNERFVALFDSVQWVVFSDHGMHDVKEKVDGGTAVMEAAQRYQLRNGVDFLMFLDSTMIRLWPLREHAKGFVTSILQELPVLRERGVAIDDTIAKRYRIPIYHSACGESIWWAKPGVIVSPDYFYDPKCAPKGMHGYFPDHEDAKGFAVVAGEGIPHMTVEQVDLVDICPTLCDMLRVRYPKENEGKSIIA